MMSRLGTKTYSRKQDCKTSIQFDQMLADKNNKPTTLAMTTVHRSRWGMTSYTSLRKTHLNGQKDVSENSESNIVTTKRIKVEPKPVSNVGEDPFSFDVDTEATPENVLKQSSDQLVQKISKGHNSIVLPKPNKFFKSRALRTSVLSNSPQKKVSNDSRPIEISGLSKVNSVSKFPVDQYSCRFVSKLSDDNNSKVLNCDVIYRNNLPSNITVQSRLPEITSSVCASNIVSHNKEYNIPTVSHCEDVYQRNVSHVYSVVRTSSPTALSSCKQENESENSSESLKYESDDRFESVFRSGVTRTYGGRKNTENVQKGNKTTTENLSTIKDVHQLPLPSVKVSSSEQKSNQESFWEEESNSEPMTISESSDNEQVDISEKNNPLFSKASHMDTDQNTRFNELKEEKSFLRRNTKKIFNSPKKHRAVYNPKYWQASNMEEEKSGNSIKENSTNLVSLADEFDQAEETEGSQLTLTRNINTAKNSDEVVTSIKCPQKQKQLYTLVKNVKQAYQCHESGETQEFNDDIEYLLEGLQIANVGTRCLSILSLASKCMGPAFRIHLRAHGIISKIFSALKDAPMDPSLSLCTAALMFVLSQDRLTMDLDADTLSLMLQLLESDPQEDASSQWKVASSSTDSSDGNCSLQGKHIEKVRCLCEQVQQKGHAKHLNLDNINTGNLAMETLLSLTSRRAGEWFKEELRSLGGMDHLVDTVSACANQLGCTVVKCVKYPTDVHLDKLRKIDRCLRVLENVTYGNAENQTYLLTYKNALLVSTCASMLELCRNSLTVHPVPVKEKPETECINPNSSLPGTVFLSCLLSLLKVLLNITHENAWGSSVVGSQNGLIDCVLMCILQTPRCIHNEKRFDVLVLSLGLMINLVEHCSENRDQIVEAHSVGSYETLNDGFELTALEALVEVFLVRLEAAKKSEEQADALLTSPEEKKEEEKRNGNDDTASSSQSSLPADDLEETLMKALQKAGKNMEHSVIGSYIALLLGCIIQNNKNYADLLRDLMPEGKFDIMVEVLKKFLNFVSLTGVVGTTGITSIQRVVEVLESS